MRELLITKHQEPLLKDINVKDALLDCAYNTEDAFKFFKRKGVDPPGSRSEKMHRERDYPIEHSQFANSRIWGMTAGRRNMDMVEDELWVSSQL